MTRQQIQARVLGAFSLLALYVMLCWVLPLAHEPEYSYLSVVGVVHIFVAGIFTFSLLVILVANYCGKHW